MPKIKTVVAVIPGSVNMGTVLLLLVGFSGNVMAEKASQDSVPDRVVSESSSRPPLLSIVPKRCVLKTGQELCRIQLTLSWEAERGYSVCLTEKDDDLALACWDDAVRGATRLLFIGDESVTYVLSTEDNEVVSEATLSVGHVSKNKRKPNRRRRRFWGFP